MAKEKMTTDCGGIKPIKLEKKKTDKKKKATKK